MKAEDSTICCLYNGGMEGRKERGREGGRKGGREERREGGKEGVFYLCVCATSLVAQC